VRAVNLIPREGRRGGVAVGGLGFSPGYAVLAVLALALVLVTVYVLTANTVSDRKAKLASVRAQLTVEQAHAARLSNYVQFQKLAQTRAETVRELAGSRFDWYRALSDLSKVVPANTVLASLTGTVAPGASAPGGTSSGGASALRGAISAPAFELTGCTKNQDDVARLMSRLRLIDGVSRVTLGNSQKGNAPAGGTAVTTGSASGSGCVGNGPTFDLVVFFQPLPGAGPTGISSVSAQPASGTAATPAAATATASNATGAAK
jgi:Tfp pilus assembly protein PilN